ncbi:PilZ domain-containing protein [Planococcus dechangensis]|uniref:PilZ domain-containing protein n=1 Tax=Planococcus dechangensis TaxID=1176255 RepID=A0ABV9MAD5_9BACL
MDDNRREFFRVSFIRAISGKVVVPEQEEVLVDIGNMSAGGLVFTASLDFALYEQVLCNFELLDEEFQLEGRIVRKLVKEPYFEYGVEFKIGQHISSRLFQQLNTYQIRKRKSVLND